MTDEEYTGAAEQRTPELTRVTRARLRRAGLSPSDAEDIVKGVLLQIHRLYREVTADEAFGPLATTIILHEIGQRHRRSTRTSMIASTCIAVGWQPPYDPQGAIRDADVEEAMERAIPDHAVRAAAMLVWGHGMSHDEVAAATGLPMEDLPRLLDTARVALRATLAAHGYQPAAHEEPRLTIPQVAEHLGITRRQVYRRLLSGHLPKRLDDHGHHYCYPSDLSHVSSVSAPIVYRGAETVQVATGGAE